MKASVWVPLPVVLCLLLLAGLLPVLAAAPAGAAGLRPAAGQYQPVPQARLLNRQLIPANGLAYVQISGVAGVPSSGASAVALNLTANTAGPGPLLLWGSGQPEPATTSLTVPLGGQLTSNRVVSKLGADGRVAVRNATTGDATVYVDITGYFTTTSATVAGSTFVPLKPARIVAGLPTAAGSSTDVAVLGRGGIPASGVTAVALSVTASQPAASGFVAVWPTGTPRPITNTVHFAAGRTTANATFAQVGTGGQLSVHNNSLGATTVHIDVQGYFLAPSAAGSGSTYVAVQPARSGARQTIGPGEAASRKLTAVTGVPATGVTAVQLTLAASTTENGFLTMYPTGQAVPGTSNLNTKTGQRATASVSAQLGTNGSVDIRNTTGTATADVDVSGYFAAPRAPAAATSVTAVGGDRSARVGWQSPSGDGGSGLTGYTITASPGGAAATAGPGDTAATVAGLTNGTSYTFTVTATNAVGSTSSTASPAVRVGTEPGAPTGVEGTGGDGHATVRWTAPTDRGSPTLSNYTVTASPGGATATAGPTDSTATVIGLTNGTSYTFAVTATNPVGSTTSTASEPVRVGTKPGAPTNVSATGGDSQAVVRWTAPTNRGRPALTGYTITASPGDATATAEPSDTAVTVTGLANGTTYSFTVTATNTMGSATSSASAAVLVGNEPGAPTDVAATGGDEQAAVRWTPPSNRGRPELTGYTITATPGGATATAGPTAAAATVTGLTNGTTYTVTVTATNAVGSATSTASAEVTVGSPGGAPGAPSGVIATAGDREAAIRWTAPVDRGSPALSGYKVTASPGGATATAGPTAEIATVAGLVNGTSYAFTVTVTNSVGSTTSTASPEVLVGRKPGAPTNITAGDAGYGTSAWVEWRAPADAGDPALTEYTITASPGGATATASYWQTSDRVDGLTRGATYTFTVTAVSPAGSTTSAPSLPIPIGGSPADTGPGAPTITGVVTGDGSITVSWTPPDDDGGSPISSYTLDVSFPSKVQVPGDARSATVRGLVNGDQYNLSLSATNATADGHDQDYAEIGLPAPEMDTTSVLQRISTRGDLSCDFRAEGITIPLFRDPVACGTYLAVDGRIYGPSKTGAVVVWTHWTPVEQSDVSGSGTTTDPFTISTTVRAGGTGVRLTQRDSYVEGEESVRTEMTVTGRGQAVRLYRAGSCLLVADEQTQGSHSTDTVTCRSGGRGLQFKAVTAGSSHVVSPDRSYWSNVQGDESWDAVHSQQELPNTVTTDLQASRMAMSWATTASPQGSAVVSEFRYLVGLPVPQTYGCAPCNSAGSARPVAWRADPVNTATGAVSEIVTDAALPGAGVTFGFTRAYTSLDTRVSSLGQSWTHPYGASLDVSGTAVTFRAEDGQEVAFSRRDDGSLRAPPGTRSTLTATANGFTMRTADQRQLRFDGNGRLIAILDRLGQGLALEYTAGTAEQAGLLTSVTDSAGRAVRLAYTGERLTQVRLPDGRHVDYGYTGKLLTSIRDMAGQTTSYTYDADGRLASATDPRGNEVFRNTYDQASGRVVSQLDANGRVTTFAWDAAESTSRTTDRNGQIWTDAYSGNVLVRQVDPLGRATEYSYDDDYNAVAVRDPRNNVTRSAYDARGNVTRGETADGSSENWTYDSVNNPLTHVDARGELTRFTYTTAGLLETVTDPAGGISTHQYDSRGLPTQLTDPRGDTTRFDHDAAGNATKVISPLGHVARASYDASGRRTTTVDPQAGADPDPEDLRRYSTTYAYDDSDREVSRTDPLGNTTASSYDANGNLTAVTDAAQRTSTFVYDRLNRVTASTDPAGRDTVSSYDPEGNLLSVRAPEGRTTTSAYDAAGQLKAETSPRGNAPGADPVPFTSTFGYDANGNLTTVSHPSGGTTSTTFDKLNRPVEVTDPDGRITSTSYDPAGNITEVTTPAGSTTQVYDQRGQRTSVTDPRGNTTTFGYDAVGNPLSRAAPSGGVTRWTYDADGRLASQLDPRSDATATLATTYGYDLAGRQTSVTDPLGNTTRYSYDVNGQPIGVTDANGNTVRHGRDELNRVETVTGPDEAVTGYTYDPLTGDVTTRTDPNGHVTGYAYDRAHRLTQVTTPNGQTRRYGYDEAGNLTRTTTARGTVTPEVGDGEIRGSYDPLDRLIGVDHTDSTPDVTYRYTPGGQRQQMTDAAGTVDYGYDPAGRIETISRGTQAWHYGYDPAGNVTSRQYPDGTLAETAFDASNRLTTVSANGAPQVTYAYDLADNMTTATLPAANGHQQTRTYDRANRLLEVANTRAGAAQSLTAYTRDPVGNPTVTSSTRGTQTRSDTAGYDPAGRLTDYCYNTTEACGPTAAQRLGYSYDPVGNRTTETRAGLPGPASTTHTYDPDDRLTTSTDPTGTRALTYDPDGNQLTEGTGATSTYGLDNKLQRTTSSTGSTSTFGYDGDGNRLNRQHQVTPGTDPTRVDYDWDVNNPLPQLATERTAGSLLRRYLHGLEPVSISTPENTYYPHTDGIGSVTGLTDAHGTPQWRNDYEPFGLQTATQLTPEAPEQRLGYSGAVTDIDLGQLHLRARQYSPNTGRFTASDPITPPLGQPAVSTYTYANNRPLTLVDPNGEWPELPGPVSTGISILTAPHRAIARAAGETVHAVANPIETYQGLEGIYQEQDSGFYGTLAVIDQVNPIASIRDSAAASFDAAQEGDWVTASDRFADGSLDVTCIAVPGAGAVKGLSRTSKAAKGAPTGPRAAAGAVDDAAGYGSTPSGRRFTKHYGTETGPQRNIPGSVVDDVIDNNPGKLIDGGKTVHYDPRNNVTVVTGDSGGIVSVHKGAPRPGQR